MVGEGDVVDGRYSLEKYLGGGGFGIVWRARDLRLDKPVAIKVLHDTLRVTPDGPRRFEQEARFAAQLRHEQIAAVTDYGNDKKLDILFICSEYIEGETLSAAIKRKTRLPADRVRDIGVNIASALALAHENGTAHRDVHPKNIMLHDKRGAILLDFGIARNVYDSGITPSGVVIGLLPYAAPERYVGEGGDERAGDLFSLGVSLWFALTGSLPHGGADRFDAWLERVRKGAPIADAERHASVAMVGVLAQMLSYDQRERPRAAALLEELCAVHPEHAPPPPTQTSPLPAKLQPQPCPEPAPPEATRPQPNPAPVPTTPQPKPPREPARPIPPIRSPATPPPPQYPPASIVTRVPEATRTGPHPHRPMTTAADTTRPLVALTAMVIVVAVIVASVALFAPLGPPRPHRSIQAGHAEYGPISVGSAPQAIAFGAGRVWVANYGDGTLTRIDPGTSRVAGSAIKVGGSPVALAIGGGYVWVADESDGTISKVNPMSGQLSGRPIAVPTTTSIAVGYGHVWVPNDSAVTRIDTRSGAPTGPPIGGMTEPYFVATGVGSVWVANQRGPTGFVARIDPALGKVVGSPTPVPAGIEGLAVAFDQVWVLNGASVVRIDPHSNKVVGAPISVDGDGLAIATGAGSVWVATNPTNTLVRIDPHSGTVVGKPIPLGSAPVAVAVGAGAVWVANGDDNSVTRVTP